MIHIPLLPNLRLLRDPFMRRAIVALLATEPQTTETAEQARRRLDHYLTSAGLDATDLHALAECAKARTMIKHPRRRR